MCVCVCIFHLHFHEANIKCYFKRKLEKHGNIHKWNVPLRRQHFTARLTLLLLDIPKISITSPRAMAEKETLMRCVLGKKITWHATSGARRSWVGLTWSEHTSPLPQTHEHGPEHESVIQWFWSRQTLVQILVKPWSSLGKWGQLLCSSLVYLTGLVWGSNEGWKKHTLSSLMGCWSVADNH